MDSRIKELTDKIFNEGIEKANEKASEILARAQHESEELISQARAEAERISQEAQRAANEIRKNTQAELKLYTDQMVNATRSQIADSITTEIVKRNVQAMIIDGDFMKQLTLAIIGKWTVGEPMIIETSEARELEQYFMSNAKELLDSGRIQIKEVNGRSTSFTILPANGSYKIEFGESEFINFFKSFLRPRLVETLF